MNNGQMDLEDLRHRYELCDPKLTDYEIRMVRESTSPPNLADIERVRTKVTSIGKSDADKATDYRDRMMSALITVTGIIDEAKKNGMRVAFQLSPPDAFGRSHVAVLEILKEL